MGTKTFNDLISEYIQGFIIITELFDGLEARSFNVCVEKLIANNFVWTHAYLITCLWRSIKTNDSNAARFLIHSDHVIVTFDDIGTAKLQIKKDGDLYIGTLKEYEQLYETLIKQLEGVIVE